MPLESGRPRKRTPTEADHEADALEADALEAGAAANANAAGAPPPRTRPPPPRRRWKPRRYGPCVAMPNSRYALRLWRKRDRLCLRMLLALDDAERRELRGRRGLAKFGARVAGRNDAHDTNLRLVTPAADPTGFSTTEPARGSLASAVVLDTVNRETLVDAIHAAEAAASSSSRGPAHGFAASGGNILLHVDYASTTRPRKGVEPLDAAGVARLLRRSSFPKPEAIRPSGDSGSQLCFDASRRRH